MKIREVAGSLVVTLPRRLAEHFDMREGDYVKPTFSKDRVVLDVKRDLKMREMDRVIEELNKESD